MEKKSLFFILKKHGFSFKKKFGQNFITDTNLLCDIVKLSGVKGTCIEIGAGGGTLTRELAKVSEKVISFEIDFTLKPILNEMTEDFNNIEFIFADFLKYNLAELEEKAGENYYVVANLPYYITTPIIMHFAENAKNYKKIVIMVQEEVAKRLCAAENTSDYGAITAALQLQNDVRIIKKVGRKSFFPVPDVDSAVVEITKNSQKFSNYNLAQYKKLVRAAFSSRRKTLSNNLIKEYGLTREQAETALISCGIEPTRRGETLSITDFINLSNFLCN